MSEHSEPSAAERLRAARALIADRDRWTRGVYARDRDGQDVAPDSIAAVRWCARGALLVGGLESPKTLAEAQNLLNRAAEPRSVVFVNDMTTHKAVMALYEDAIFVAEGGSSDD